MEWYIDSPNLELVSCIYTNLQGISKVSKNCANNGSKGSFPV